MRYFNYVLLKLLNKRSNDSVFTLKLGLNVTSDQVNISPHACFIIIKLNLYSVLLAQVAALNGLNIMLQHENRGKCAEWERRLFCA